MDGEVYSEPDPLDASSERNVFRTQVQGADTLDVRIVNINLGSSSRRAATFELSVRAEPLAACSAGPMMATIGADFSPRPADSSTDDRRRAC